MVYPSPNDKSVRSASFVLSLDLAYKKLLEQTTYSGSVRGALDTNITELRRIYKLVNMAYTYDLGSMVGNTTVTINRSDNFGFDQPFSVLSITGSVQIDGVPFTITSTAIPWRTSSANGVPYFPLSGLVTATGPNGEKIVTQFGATGASCSITPAGATAPSVRVDNCSLV